MINNKALLQKVPQAPGVYLMRDASGGILYIGKASRLKNRIASYFRKDVPSKTSAMLRSMRHIDFVLAASDSEALILENALIKQYQPYYNTMWRDDKTYPYLKLTLREDFPRLLFSRKKIRDGSAYFGPYPHVYEIKKLVAWLRKVFKWRPCNIEFSFQRLPKFETIKSCIYLQSRSCLVPCTGKLPPQEYKKSIKEIELFLRGKQGKLSELWKKEMLKASKAMEFEVASDLRDRLKALELLKQKVTVRELKPEDLITSIQATDTLEMVRADLRLKKWPVVMECFDISTISGVESVGSMVRFVNAKPDKSQYRKFKINTITGVNDTAMIEEVVFRRYKRLRDENQPMPDLIVVDGGKGQLSAARESIRKLSLAIPIISIAKKQEEIFFPDAPHPLRLARDSITLKIIQFMRDESHRFAITYHKLRRKHRFKL